MPHFDYNVIISPLTNTVEEKKLFTNEITDKNTLDKLIEVAKEFQRFSTIVHVKKFIKLLKNIRFLSLSFSVAFKLHGHNEWISYVNVMLFLRSILEFFLQNFGLILNTFQPTKAVSDFSYETRVLETFLILFVYQRLFQKKKKFDFQNAFYIIFIQNLCFLAFWSLSSEKININNFESKVFMFKKN